MRWSGLHPILILSVTGSFTGIDHRLEDFRRVRFVAHQRRAHLVLDHLFHRAAEIEVDDVRAAILGKTGGFGHDFGLAARQLHRQKALVRLPLRHFQRLAVLADDGLAGEHLGHNQLRSEFPDNAAEWLIGDPRHRGKNNRALKRRSAEPDGLQSRPAFCERRSFDGHGPDLKQSFPIKPT